MSTVITSARVIACSILITSTRVIASCTVMMPARVMTSSVAITALRPSTLVIGEGDIELYSGATGLTVTFNSNAIAKLRALYKLHNPSSATSFEAAALVMGLRYRSLGGGGFQLALPTAAFELLRQDFGALGECFASPLNCWFGEPNRGTLSNMVRQAGG